MKYYLTNKAKSDLKTIGRYTENTWGKRQRGIYLRKLDKLFHGIAKMPLKGKPCDNIRLGYRKLIVDKHIIFYRFANQNEIEIVRILHSSMDVETQLNED